MIYEDYYKLLTGICYERIYRIAIGEMFNCHQHYYYDHDIIEEPEEDESVDTETLNLEKRIYRSKLTEERKLFGIVLFF